MIFIIFFSLVFITTFALWKYVRLKHDVYEYTEKLDNTINYMLKNGELKTTPYENDDLWEKIYEKLVRLSHLYTHKNLEISEEKDKLKELVSDISHQTKTSIANIKLYLEIMTDESDFKKNQEYMRSGSCYMFKCLSSDLQYFVSVCFRKDTILWIASISGYDKETACSFHN